jgi:two-component system sensor histidine kinase VanS|nr:HAMP domain-containing sensor histidine kinase [uncultured Acetatifactor sp.]
MKIRNILKRSGGTATKSKTKDKDADYSAFQVRIMWRFCTSALVSTAIVILLYLFLWKERMGEWILRLIELWMDIDHEDAFYVYNDYFRGIKEVFFAAAIVLIFLLLLVFLFRWLTRYFREINQGIDCLLSDREEQIRLSQEMQPFEIKLNTVQNILIQREQAARAAEQRKNELVMYLAHDIRTPLTSIIGYLRLLEQIPDLPDEEKEKYVHISLEKTYRLEKMINEFFEITCYNTQQITIASKAIDLYYLLAQVIDEHLPLFTEHGNYITFHAAESLEVCGDPERLARVFNNLLKNAVAYSSKGTEITVNAEETPEHIVVTVSNHGKTIPDDKLETLFEKFYRLDESRTSNTGGTGVGLAIAKEIVLLHGGTITADSKNGLTAFTVTLPISRQTTPVEHVVQ